MIQAGGYDEDGLPDGRWPETEEGQAGNPVGKASEGDLPSGTVRQVDMMCWRISDCYWCRDSWLEVRPCL